MGEIGVTVLSTLAAGIISAILSSLLTIAGIRVHIEYLRAADDRHEKAIVRAHERIDAIEKET